MFSLVPWKKRSRPVALRRQPETPFGFENHPLAQLREEFDTLMQQYFGDQAFGNWPSLNLWQDFGQNELSVNFDIEDRDKEYVVRAEAPGFEPDEFDVQLRGDVLTVRAEHKEEKKEGNGSALRYGSFVESFTIPEGVDTEHIDARYHSGILEINLPKSDQGQGKRIEVKQS